ncbi:forkhead box protein J1-A [Gouania willdenowi]|nr:forkhead box protein J1-A-like [Gouania willdenowi]
MLCLDDSLTSLQWLEHYSILGAPAPQPPLLHAPASPQAADPASPLTPGRPTEAAYSRALQRLTCSDHVDYRTNAHVKPPYSYATLICMALKDSTESKVTLSAIYRWITDNFCYYRHADPTWQNSIRHNLSLNKCFIKVPRQKNEPGKGGFWKIDPQYAERLLSAECNKKRVPPVQINPALQSRYGINIQRRTPRRLSLSPTSPWDNPSWDPHLSEATMLGAWPLVRGRGRHKRKQWYGSGNVSSKAARYSSSPLLSVDEPTEEGPLKGDFDWDALLDSALSGELSLEEGELLSPVVKDEDLMVRGTHIHLVQAPIGLDDAQRSSELEEETFLATSFLDSPWSEADERSSSSEDFLCSSNVNLDQLFGLEVSLGGDSGSL